MESTMTGHAPATERKLFPGWIAFAGGLIAVIIHGAISSCGGYVLSSMLLEENLPSTLAGYCASIISLCSVLFATPFGVFLNKRGHKWGLLLGELAALIGFSILAFAPANAALTIIMYFFLGFSVVAACKVGGPSLVNRWFQHRKDIPMTLVIAAGSLGSIFSGAIAAVMASNGWRSGWVFLLGMTVFSLIVVVLLVRDDVHGIGEVRDGVAWRTKKGLSMDDAEVVKKSNDASEEGRFGLVKNPRFLLFSLGCLLRMGMYAGSVGYITLIIVSKGFAREDAVLAVGSVALSSSIGRLSAPLWNKLLHFSNMTTNRVANIIMAIGGLLVFFSSNLSLLSLAATLIGFSYGMGYVSQTLTLPDLFPQYPFATSFGAFTTVVNLSFIFPTVVGLLGSALGGYSEIYLVMGIINAIFAILFGFCKTKDSAAPAST